MYNLIKKVPFASATPLATLGSKKEDVVQTPRGARTNLTPSRLAVSALVASAAMVSVLSSPAHASWGPVKYHITNPLRGGVADPYLPTDFYYNSNSNNDPYQGGGTTLYHAQSIQGTISAIFTWIPDGTPVPGSVTVYEYSYAEWYAALGPGYVDPTTVTGMTDDGFQDTQYTVVESGGGHKTGYSTRYQSITCTPVTNTDGSITITTPPITLKANCNSNNYLPRWVFKGSLSSFSYPANPSAARTTYSGTEVMFKRGQGKSTTMHPCVLKLNKGMHTSSAEIGRAQEEEGRAAFHAVLTHC